MIPIRLTAERKKEMEAAHLNYFRKHFQNRFNDTTSITDPVYLDFLRHLQSKIEDLLIGTPARLEQLRLEILNLYPGIYADLKTAKITPVSKASLKRNIPAKYAAQVSAVSQIEKLKTKLSQIFNYDHFEQCETEWGAYPFVDKLNVPVCPYCNRSFITNYRSVNGKGRTRPQLDHFYSQSSYPYFALSIYNLVPSCYVCNSNLKNQKEFTLESHLNPYEENSDYLNRVRFTIRFARCDKSQDGVPPDYLKVWQVPTELMRIEIKPKRRTISRESLVKIRNNIQVFKIRQLYNFHKDYAQEIIHKKIVYSPDRIDGLVNEFPLLFPSRESVLRLILSNYMDDAQIQNRVLAKFARDIWEELSSPEDWT